MGVFSLLEKAINEHGSAAILKERLELVKDKHGALEEKLSSALSAILNKDAEIQRLKEENSSLISELEKLKISEDQLEEDAERVLEHLGANTGQTEETVAAALGIGQQTAILHLTSLENLGLVQKFDAYAHYLWSLTDKGRLRLHKAGLLQ